MFFLYIEDMEKLLLLQSIDGLGPVRIRQFLNSSSTLLHDDDYFSYIVEEMTGNPIGLYRERVDRILDDCIRLGVEIIINPINTIIDAPILFFLKGDGELLNRRNRLGVVGTRHPTSKGVETGRRNIRSAVIKGWTTVSGFAKGCDTLCYRETLRLGGEVITVLPMGYHRRLTKSLLERELFISEYPPNTPVKKYRLVRRNRIITGLSKILYVVEAYGGGSGHSMGFASQGEVPILATKDLLSKELYRYHPHFIGNSDEFDLFLKKMYKI